MGVKIITLLVFIVSAISQTSGTHAQSLCECSEFEGLDTVNITWTDCRRTSEHMKRKFPEASSTPLMDIIITRTWRNHGVSNDIQTSNSDQPKFSEPVQGWILVEISQDPAQMIRL